MHEGDEDRLRRLYAEEAPAPLAYALRRGATSDDAADLVADVFLVAWRRIRDVPRGEEARRDPQLVDLNALVARITAFEEHYRQIAQPFDWTFTRQDLHRILAKIADRERTLQFAA
jgi:hypothetical protein